MRNIAKAHVRAFKDALLKMPARRRRDGEGKPLTLSPASVQKQLNAIKAVLSWAVAQGYMENNPATGISHARGNGIHGARTRRVPYEADDLRKLFGPAFSGKEGADAGFLYSACGPAHGLRNLDSYTRRTWAWTMACRASTFAPGMGGE